MLDAARQEYGELMDELPEHTFSPEFEREMKKLVLQADHPIRHRWMWIGRIAAITAALLVLVSAAAAVSGYDLLQLLTHWTAEQYTLAPGRVSHIEPDDIHIPEEPEEYADLQSALTAYGLNRPVVPQLPEGFVLDDLVVDDKMYSSIVFSAAYCRGDDVIVILISVYLKDTDNFGNFQKDEGDPIPYETGGIIHLLATNAGRPVALWANGPAECAISGDITMEELKEMLDSIYE